MHSVIVHPKGPWQGFEVEVKGKLAALVGGGFFPEARYNSGSYVVAGDRLHQSPLPMSRAAHREIASIFSVYGQDGLGT